MYTTKNEIFKKENLHFKALNCCLVVLALLLIWTIKLKANWPVFYCVVRG